MRNSSLFAPEPGGHPVWLAGVYFQEMMPKHSRRDMSLANDTRLADRNKRAPSTQDLAAGVADWCTINTVGSIGGDDESSLGQLYNAQSASFPHDPNKHGAGGPDKLDKSRMASDDSITASLQSAHDHGPTRAFDHLAIDQTMHVATLCRDLPPLIRLVQHSQVGNTNAVAGRTGPGHCESDCEAFQCMCRRILHAHDWTNLGRDPGALAYASPEKSQGIDDNEDPLECRGETCITFAAEQYRTERTAMVMRTLAGPDCPQQQGKVDTRSPSSGSHVGSRSHEKERREAPLASEYVAWLLFALVMMFNGCSTLSFVPRDFDFLQKDSQSIISELVGFGCIMVLATVSKTNKALFREFCCLLEEPG